MSAFRLEVKSVANGKVRSLSSLKDGVLSKRLLGNGLVVEFPKDLKKGEVFSPVSGIVTTSTPEKHAYEIKTAEGIEILIHIGLETVLLKGKGLKSTIKKGQKIKAGDKLVEVDIDLIKDKVPSVNPVVIVVSGQRICSKSSGHITVGEKIFRVK